MSREAFDWLNRVGMILGFFAFWFAAPEFIGEARLRTWEQSLAKILKKIGNNLPLIFGLFTISFCAIYLAHHWPTKAEMIENLREQWLPWVHSRRRYSWSQYLLSLTGPAVLQVVGKLGPPLIAKMANDSKVRQTSLALGAMLFTMSFILQFIASFAPAVH